MIAFKLKPTASQQSKLIWLSSCWMEKRSGNSFTCHWVQMRAWVVDLMVNWWLQMIQLFFKSSSANNNKCRVLRPPTSISVDLCWINFRLNRTFSPFAIVCTLKYCTRFVNLGTERPLNLKPGKDVFGVAKSYKSLQFFQPNCSTVFLQQITTSLNEP